MAAFGPCPASPAPSSSPSATPRCPTCSGPDVRLLFVGINPGLWTAATQTHFAHPVNRFYPALLRAGILEHPIDPSAGMTDADRDLLRARGIGITNLVHRATARADELTREELREGGAPPRGAGTPHRAARRRGRRDHGVPPRLRPPEATLGGASRSRPRGAELWVVPNPSGLNAHETVETLAAAYAEPARAAGVI